MTDERLKRAAATVVAAAVGRVIVDGIREAVLRIQMESRIANHARFEGARAPHEAALAKARREIEELNEAVDRHAMHEGIEPPGRRA